MRPIRRRQLLIAAASAALGVSFARAQPAKHARIGFLAFGSRSSGVHPFSSAMGKLGWVEGRNLTVDWGFADGDVKRLPKLAAGIVHSAAQVIVAQTNIAAVAARQATTSVPIVVMYSQEPVKTGFAKSLTRPGGNVTGVLYADPAFSAKSIELLKETLPGMKRIAALYHPWPGNDHALDAVDEAARTFGVSFLRFPIVRGEDLGSSFDSIKRSAVDVLRVTGGGQISVKLDEIIAFAAENRLPSFFTVAEGPERGGLMAYTPSFAEIINRVASIVDKVLTGANPAETPFEYPTRYTLVINLKTARQLNLSVPQSILLRSDKVIE